MRYIALSVGWKHIVYITLVFNPIFTGTIRDAIRRALSYLYIFYDFEKDNKPDLSPMHSDARGHVRWDDNY